MIELSPSERIILAIDTSEIAEAERLARIAKEAGARFIKLGLEIQTATSWEYCADLAARNDLDWVADAKLDDISNTVAGAVRNIAAKSHTPFGITMHAKAGLDSMRVAQETAGEVIVFGVTELTSIPKDETEARYGISRPELVTQLAFEMAEMGLRGIVASPEEVKAIKDSSSTQNLFAMIPGVRSTGSLHNDQSNVGTPGETIRNGADLLVIGRQITQAADMREAYESVIEEITNAIR